MPVFIVSFNSAGCLPDEMPTRFATVREAWDYVAAEVELINEDADYLPTHGMMNLINRNEVGRLPFGESSLYGWNVELVECVCPADYRAKGWESVNRTAHSGSLCACAFPPGWSGHQFGCPER